MTTKTRKRASATSPVVVTDHGDGTKTFEVDPKTAEHLTTIPAPVVETKLLGMYGQRIGAHTAKPSLDMNPTVATIRGRSGAREGAPAKIESVHAVARRTARKRRISDALYKRKSALTEDQKSALIDGLTDENVLGIHLSPNLVEALLFSDSDDPEIKAAIDEVVALAEQAGPMIERVATERDAALQIARKLIEAGTKFVTSHEEKTAALLDGLEVVDDAFVFRFTAAGRKFVSVVRETEPEPVAPEVKTFERTPGDSRFGDQYETPALKAGQRVERKTVGSVGSFEEAELLLRRHDAAKGKR
jgi:hypothetical protein